jgi:hypothetical protein
VRTVSQDIPLLAPRKSLRIISPQIEAHASNARLGVIRTLLDRVNVLTACPGNTRSKEGRISVKHVNLVDTNILKGSWLVLIVNLACSASQATIDSPTIKMTTVTC